MTAYADELVLQFLRKELFEHLATLKMAQQEFFWKVFPNGATALTETQLRQGIDLCHRTQIKNEKDAT